MAEKWYLYQDGQQIGPFSWEELYQKAASRTLQPDDMVWNQDMTGWTRVAAIPELLPQQPAAPPPLNMNQSTNQQQNTILPQQSGGSQLPPRGSYSQKSPQNYEQAGPLNKNGKETNSMKLKFRATPVFRINWIGIALVGIIVVAALIAKLFGL